MSSQKKNAKNSAPKQKPKTKIQKLAKEISTENRLIRRSMAVSSNTSTHKQEKKATEALVETQRKLEVLERQIKTDNPPELAKVLLSYTMPFGHAPVRVSTQYTTNATALASPWGRFALQMNTGSTGSSNQLDSSLSCVFQFRSLCRHMVVYDSTTTASTYSIYWPNAALGSATTVLVSYANGAAPPDTFVKPLYAAYASGYQPHGSKLYPGLGTINNQKALTFWVDSKTGASSFSLSFAVLVSNCIFKLWRWDPEGSVLVSTTTALTGNTSATLTVPSSGYYTFSYASVNNVGTFSATISLTGTDYFSHLPIPDLDSNLAVLDGTIIPSFAHLVTNKAAPLNRQGEIATIQVPQGYNWFDLLTFDSIATLNGAVTRPAALGNYVFAKPTQPEDLNVRSSVNSDDGVLEHCYFDLENESSFLATFIRVAEGAGRDFYIQYAVGLNFQTGNVFWVVSGPEVSPSTYQKAMEKLRDIPQYHENPTHIKDIARRIGKIVDQAVPYVAKYGPIAAKFLQGML